MGGGACDGNADIGSVSGRALGLVFTILGSSVDALGGNVCSGRERSSVRSEASLICLSYIGVVAGGGWASKGSRLL